MFAEPVKLDESWTPTVVPKSDAEKDSIREVRWRCFLVLAGAAYDTPTCVRCFLQIMSKNILFRTLEGEQLELLIDVMVKKTFKDGEEIITQGAQGDFYYVLQSGTCDIFKDGDLVLQVSFGMGFGELVSRATVVIVALGVCLTDSLFAGLDVRRASSSNCAGHLGCRGMGH